MAKKKTPTTKTPTSFSFDMSQMIMDRELERLKKTIAEPLDKLYKEAFGEPDGNASRALFFALAGHLFDIGMTERLMAAAEMTPEQQSASVGKVNTRTNKPTAPDKKRKLTLV